MSSASRLAKIRARLDLPTVRRASGLLDGHHRSIFTGHGQDFDDMVEYHPGDDVGDIDWKASARSGYPVIRRFVHESNLAMVLAVDSGRSMAATAPSGERKSEVALFAADVVAYLARARDRKSTRLNSSHVAISYAVFCLKKKITELVVLVLVTVVL